jgi:hypothetical protein
VVGISPKGANQTMFTIQDSGKQVSVAGYFADKGSKLRYPGLECVDVGAAGKPVYIPPELCTWVPAWVCWGACL